MRWPYIAIAALSLVTPLSATADVEEKAECLNLLEEGSPCIEWSWLESEEGKWVAKTGPNCSEE